MITPEEFTGLGKFEAIAAYASLYQFLLYAAETHQVVQSRCDQLDQELKAHEETKHEVKELLAEAREIQAKISSSVKDCIDSSLKDCLESSRQGINLN